MFHLTAQTFGWEETVMTGYRDGDQLDHELFDAMVVLLGQMLRSGESLAGQLGVPMFCLKALHRLDTSVTMKDLGEQMHCDRSFITMIADTLEERGLARREPNDTDRRVKNLVLTPDGLTLKRRLEGALVTQMPWSQHPRRRRAGAPPRTGPQDDRCRGGRM